MTEPQPGTRHNHPGGVLHDHAGGKLPHKHNYFDRYLDSQEQKLGRWEHEKEYWRASYRNPIPGASTAFSFGSILIVLGALGLFATSAHHSACSSVWASGYQPCNDVNEIWTLGLVGVGIGIALLIVGAILRGKS